MVVIIALQQLSTNQQRRPVAIFSRTLNNNKIKHHAVEKEAAAIIEEFRQRWHFLLVNILTDQKSITYMNNDKHKSKIENDNISRCRVELSQYKFDIIYLPGKENVAADALKTVSQQQSIL